MANYNVVENPPKKQHPWVISTDRETWQGLTTEVRRLEIQPILKGSSVVKFGSLLFLGRFPSDNWKSWQFPRVS